MHGKGYQIRERIRHMRSVPTSTVDGDFLSSSPLADFFYKERQEEVDKRLLKTRKEMHAQFPPGGRSPRPTSGPTSASHTKPLSENLQTSAMSHTSQIKRKKREKVDQGLDHPGKRERSSKTDDDDSGLLKSEDGRKYEIAEIFEKGGLLDFAGVEKLVHLIQRDGVEKMDLISRSMLASMIAATEKFDCLSHFVQLGGLPVFDEWLQDIHKGKIGDMISSKDSDKSVQDFLLVLLRALDKLPVNLHTLQLCNIGKSVNHLRSHKNSEIQKKARSLVDTWKKRVEAEMNMIDSKSGSTQNARVAEVSPGGNRHTRGSPEISMKSSVAQLSLSKSTSPKSASLKALHGETATNPRISVGSASDLPSTVAKEEKSGSSTHSPDYSQSFSGKEDARSSTAGSMSGNKVAGGSSRHRKAITSFPSPSVSTIQKEPLQKTSTSERMSVLTSEKAHDSSSVEGRNHKLIVKIPNRVRSPAQSGSGGGCDEPSIMNSRASSPVLLEKQDHIDRRTKEKNVASRGLATFEVNTESWQSNDFKDLLTGSDEGDVSPHADPDEDHSRTDGDIRKPAKILNSGSSSSGIDQKSGFSSSVNPVDQSCAKSLGANASVLARDDGGMNLLATVAAREMSKSDFSSPNDSPRNFNACENSCPGTESNLRSSPEGTHEIQSDDAIDEDKTPGANSGASLCKEGPQSSCHSFDDTIGGSKLPSCSIKESNAQQHRECSNSYSMDVQPATDKCLGAGQEVEEEGIASMAIPPASSPAKVFNGEISKPCEDANAPIQEEVEVLKGNEPTIAKDKRIDDPGCLDSEKNAVESPLPLPSSEKDGANRNDTNQRTDNGLQSQQKPSSANISEDVGPTNAGTFWSANSGRDLVPEILDGNPDEKGSVCSFNHYGTERPFLNVSDCRAIRHEEVVSSGSAGIAKKGECKEKDVEIQRNLDKNLETLHDVSAASPSQQSDQRLGLRDLKESNVEMADPELPVRAADTSCSDAGKSVANSKQKFDLNAGFVVEDGKSGEPMNLALSELPPSVPVVDHPLSLPVSSVSNGFPASITVAAPAKGPFIPLEELLQSKGELGWKGSAATSAFRPAEPRKVVEMPLGSAHTDAAGTKHDRPVLDIDLNVPDERALEEMAYGDASLDKGTASDIKTGGFDLDLNRIVDSNDLGHPSTSYNSRVEPSFFPVKSTSSGGFSNGLIRKDFDLNSGPVFDDSCAELLSFSQNGRGSVQSRMPAGGIRMNNAEIGNFSTWFNPSHTYSAVTTIPAIFHDTVDKPFPVVTQQRGVGSTGRTLFTPDMYRGSVLSSSPAMPYSSTPIHYPVFPVGTSFPAASAQFSGSSTAYLDSSSSGRLFFPGLGSQFIGPTSAVSSHGQRPYMVGFLDGSSRTSLLENSCKWDQQGLDLNAGPVIVDVEGKNETLHLASRQFSTGSTQPLTDEQARILHLAGGSLKRKEPVGGWDADSYRYKQSSWQ